MLLSELNPLPISIMPIVAVSWFVYGLVSGDPYIIISNCAGSLLSIAYLIGILPLMKYNNSNNNNSGTESSSDSSNSNNSNNKLLFWTHATILLSTATTLGVWTMLGFITSSATEPLGSQLFSLSSAMVKTSGVVDEVLGMYASILFIILCCSPLSTIKQVLTTKNSSSILGRLTIAQCINTTLWSVYGLGVNDRFIYGPNVIGLGLGLIQLALKIIFPASRGRPPPVTV